MAVRAVFIRPTNKTGSGYLTKWGFLPTPLGLLDLAGEVLRIPGSRVKIIDMEGDNLSIEETVNAALEMKPDIVGITLHATAAHVNASIIARKIKERSPETLLVAGGHHATFLPKEIVRSGFDVSVLGEGDETMYEIAEAVDQGTGLSGVRGIVYRDEEGIHRTRPRPLIRDLDTLPMPPLDLLEREKYTFKVFGNDQYVACLETARGCPYACDFCSVTPTWGNKWRNKSNDRIMAELRDAKAHGYNWVFFTDDIFVVFPNVRQRDELFDRIIEEDLGLKYIVQMRADVTAKNKPLIEKAARAGVKVAFLGVESGSEEVLKKMHKGEFTPQSVDAVNTLSRNGIVTLVGMMVGAPYERLRDIIASIRFSRKLARAGADAIQFSIYTPLPGTRVFDDAVRNNLLFTLDWDRYDIVTPVMKTRLGPVTVQIAQFYATYSFYLYKYFRGKIKNIKERDPEKERLMKNSMDFIMKMMPSYLRDIADFPRFLLQTYDLYWQSKRRPNIDPGHVEEVMETSNKIVYEITDGGKNPYFLIKESK
ncbi:B12-binding domain-containing radical SAM protein [Thermogymnomonas acidicola]|uniref:B12-binding domain-containing radical SAM protein n=1 Tax=Thermogymnomonas acidicola TaxID=399579 RepID=A0AA37BPU0_9ARCH|nr:radical SAM protein [Thermogymnomonas acidicola]GGM66107.1 B12-binding domain-containing radical SAM protein [Thermogymnomonas acidicola]